MCTDIDDKKAAYHEAGHAVVALESGFSIRYITIRPRENGVQGRTVLNHSKARKSNLSLPWIYGGPMAQLIYFPDDYDKSNKLEFIDFIYRNGFFSDFSRGMELLTLQCNTEDTTEIDEIIEELIGKVYEILGSNWGREATNSIAKELLKKKTLTGKEAKEIFLRAKNQFNGSLFKSLWEPALAA